MSRSSSAVVTSIVMAFALAAVSHAQLPDTPLVEFNDTWHYRKGTSEPVADWKTIADAALDASWLTGPGGFGYGDGDDGTILTDMQGNYVTAYARKTFDITAGMDTARHLRLTVDYDDACIVYLDGAEVFRSFNVPGAPGTPYAFDEQTLTGGHEASGGSPAEPVEVIDLGTLASNLATGSHILSAMVINLGDNSSDSSLIVDFDLVDPPPPPMDVTWTLADSPVILTADFDVDPTATLTIEAGVEVVLSADVSIKATDGGHIDIAGTPAAPVVLRAATAGTDWGEISATGAGGSMTIRHADISDGEVRFLTGVTGVLEDSKIRSCEATAMVFSRSAAAVTLRRCHISDYEETNFKDTLTVLECCLFEDSNADAVDFDGAPTGSAIRQCTFRGGPGNNTDAIDLGPTNGIPSTDVLIEDCLMYDFGDKGVSLGDFPDDAENTLIRNCLIYNVVSGVQAKHGATVVVHNCTIADSTIGLHGFEKAGGTGGGIFTDTYNNILAGNTDAIVIETNTTITVESTNAQGVDWPGTGNINADPLFRDSANFDYRLLPGSPCFGTGRGGADMGVTFPVGGRPDVPGALQLASFDGSQAVLAWTDPDDKETAFLVEQSSDGSVWTEAATTAADATGATITGLGASPSWQFRVRGTNFLGESFNSNLVFTNATPGDSDGDGMSDDWENMFPGLNANDPGDANGDLDFDGATNLEEFLACTDPTDAGSVFRIDAISRLPNGDIELQFAAQANKTYTVEYSETLQVGSWQFLVDVAADPVQRPAHTVTDTPPAGKTFRAYRLATPALP